MNLEEDGKLQRVILQNPVGPINQEKYNKHVFLPTRNT